MFKQPVYGDNKNNYSNSNKNYDILLWAAIEYYIYANVSYEDP
ncbi:MAG TPA: hypothetical protein VER14_06900 [Phototrophicaceae bacterium]|nr:hypothetical protein [Phototrophicaceae bacterium]